MHFFKMMATMLCRYMHIENYENITYVHTANSAFEFDGYTCSTNTTIATAAMY